MENNTQREAKEWLENNLMRETFARTYYNKLYKELTETEILHLYESFANQTSTPMEGGSEDRYSISLVYVNQSESMLRVLITDANSPEEALGKAIKNFEIETKNFNLSMKVVLKLSASRQDNELKDAVELLRELKECDYCSVIGDEKIDNFLSKHSK